MRAAWVWVVWLAAVLVMLSITRNPLYLLIILLCVLVVGAALWRAGAESLQPLPYWKLAIWIILLATLFNTFTSHHGETVLFTIPGRIPLLSGKITLEAVVYGATNGLVLTGMLASFAVLNLALPVRDLVSMIPRAFFPVAVVTSIAVTYLPTTVRQFRQIREAQAVRGHQMHGLLDWLPLMMPLLVGGLEHAMQLAEAMTARGFASAEEVPPGVQVRTRILLLVGLVMLAAGWLVQIGSQLDFGWAVLGAGAFIILLVLWSLGKYSPRTSYRRAGWSWMDGIVLLMSVFLLAAVLFPLPGLGSESLYYDPYPKITLPPFNPYLGLVLLGLLLPGLLGLILLNGEDV